MTSKGKMCILVLCNSIKNQNNRKSHCAMHFVVKGVQKIFLCIKLNMEQLKESQIMDK